MNLQFAIASIPHLWPYFLLLAAYFLLSFQSELLNDRTFGVYALTLLIFFAGLRDAITPDMKRYALLYQEANGLGPPVLEPSFTFLSRLLYILGFDYHALFFSYTAITLFCVYLGIRNQTRYTKLALLFYVLLPGYFLNLFVEMRQMCAVAITFCAIALLKRKNMRMRMPIFFGLAALSALFHSSAALFWAIVLALHRFIRKAHSKFCYFSLILGSLLIPTSVLISAISLLAMPVLPERYHGYIQEFLKLETGLTESGQLLKTLIYVAMAVCFILLWQPKEGEEADYVPLNLFVLGVVILGLTRSFAAASRMSYFFLIYQIILAPAILERIRDRLMRLLTAYVAVLFYLAQFTWGLFYYSVEASNYPYLHYQNVLLSVFK